MTSVIVAMSGGVDSAVAAALLKAQGYEVTGVMMRIWDGETPATEQSGHHSCYGPEDADIEDAQRVASVIGIPLHVFDLRNEYRAEVIDYVRREYSSGRTPNPCIRCNSRVKLESMVQKARDAGIAFDCVATGHYVRVEWNEGTQRYLLRKALDELKDQSYFLYSLSQSQLARSLFPIGDFTKDEVRQLAADFNLGVADKSESQDFISGGYTSLVMAEAHPGPILDCSGRVLGEHRGIQFYTVGQRKGLGLPARRPVQ